MDTLDVIKVIKSKIEGLEMSIKLTINDKNQFERNCKNSYMASELKKRLETLERHESYIGKQVYKYKKNVIYKDVPETDHFNPLEETPVLFTKELFEEFKTKILDIWIKRFSEDLIKRPVSQSSTNKLANLQFEWLIECDQEIIRFLYEVSGKEFY